MTQATSTLIAHSGTKVVSYDELCSVKAPEPTATWYPLSHEQVHHHTKLALERAGFVVERERLAMTKGGARFFGTLDLTSPVASGVTLAVGLRNSIDKSLPIGFAAGTRVFVCDNLAFAGDIKVVRKHTRYGLDTFINNLKVAIKTLGQFQSVETFRIHKLEKFNILPASGAEVILRAFEDRVLNPEQARTVAGEWRNSTFEQFRNHSLWSLENAFTYGLSKVHETNPSRFGQLTQEVRNRIDTAYSHFALSA